MVAFAGAWNPQGSVWDIEPAKPQSLEEIERLESDQERDRQLQVSYF